MPRLLSARTVAIFGAALVVLLAFACVTTTQPFAGSAEPDCGAHRADPAALRAHVDRLAVALHPRDHLHIENLDAAARWIGEELGKTGARISEQTWTVDGGVYRNVVARFGPDSEERIVVGAHYDTCGPQPGADDNASGVAGLLELGRLLAKAPPPIHVELVAYSLEEPPHFRTPYMGSAVHAAALEEAKARVRLMISLEMIGYFRDEPDTQHFPLAALGALYPSEGNFVAVVGKFGQGATVRRVKRAMRGATPLPVYSINAPAFVRGIDFSDHLNYWARGWPAVMVTDTSFFRNAHYHEQTDTPETLDYARMAQVVTGVHCAVHAVARGD